MGTKQGKGEHRKLGRNELERDGRLREAGKMSCGGECTNIKLSMKIKILIGGDKIGTSLKNMHSNHNLKSSMLTILDLSNLKTIWC